MREETVKWEMEEDDEETVPLAQDGSFKDHGSFRRKGPKNGFAINELNKSYTELDGEDGKDDDEPMSTARKFAFVMSFNVWALYFAVFLWLIPCRTDNCLPWKEWSYTLENAELTSNLESIPVDRIHDAILIGYSTPSIQGEEEGRIAALTSGSGNKSWTETLDFVPLKLISVGIGDSDREDGGTSILAVGETGMALLNSSDGKIMWQKQFVNENVVLSTLPVLQNCSGGERRILYVRERAGDVQLCVLDMFTGQTISFFHVPCGNDQKTKVEVISVHNWNQSMVVCRLQRQTAVWAIQPEVVCRDEREPDEFSDVKYSHMISFDNEVPQDDYFLGTSVTNDLAIIGWRNVIAAVSMQNIPFLEKWRKTFQHSMVRSFLIGRFTSSGADELAIATEDFSSKITISIVELSGGSRLAYIGVSSAPSTPAGAFGSMIPVPRRLTGKKTDAVIIQTILREQRSGNGSVYPSNHIYTLVKFGQKPPFVKKLLTVQSHINGPVSASLTGYNPGLVVAKQSGNRSWIISRRVRFIDEATWCLS